MINRRRDLRLTVLKVAGVLRRHPFALAVICLLLYLIVFQHSFVLSRDIWAEGYAEYLNKALFQDWSAVINPSWEGYLTVLPSFFSKLYVQVNAPLSEISVYYRFVAISYAVGSLAATVVVAKKLIPKLWQRLLLCVLLILPLWHVSAFSFINIWYIGFVPIVLLCLNAERLKLWQQVIYAIFSILVAFTKPSIILLPFIVYRAIKTKEYVSNIIIGIACLLQTYLLFFATSNGERHVALGIIQVAKGMYIGCGAEILKLFQITPNCCLVFLANAVLAGLLIIIVRRRGWLVAGLLAFGYAFSVYAYVLAPVSDGQPAVADAMTIFCDKYKIQRELLIYEFFIIISVMSVPDAWKMLVKKIRPSKKRFAAILGIAILLCGSVAMYRPIDTDSTAVSINVATFSSALDVGRPACMPVAPLPIWSLGSNWMLQYGGGCVLVNGDEAINYEDMDLSLVDGQQFAVKTPTQGQHLMTVILLVRTAHPQTPTCFYLRDQKTGTIFTTSTLPSSRSNTQFIAFDVAPLSQQDSYEFVVNSNAESFIGTFMSTKEIANILYFMDEKQVFSR